jgi:hypothetical protein
MVNRSNVGVPASSATAGTAVSMAGLGFRSERRLREKGARRGVSAPQSFTGCVSEVSFGPGRDHRYTDALKRYAEVYEAYQAYLMPIDPLAAHDYELGAGAPTDSRHFGCLDATLVEDTVGRNDITDEDIERCGYLGWLHR